MALWILNVIGISQAAAEIEKANRERLALFYLSDERNLTEQVTN